MNRKTRLFLWVGGGVLAVGIGVGLLVSYLGLSAIALGGSDGPRDLKYVPADARLVAYADFQDLAHSEFRRVFLQHHGEPKGVGQLESRTGINPERDIDSLVVFLAGLPAEAGHDQTAVLARGRFDVVRIEGLMREHNGEPIDYKGKRLVHHAGEDGDVALTFLEPDLVAFGSAAAVRQTIDLATGGQNVTGNEQIMSLVRSVNGGNVWAVGKFDAVAQRDRLPKEMAARIPAINWFAASARVDSALDGVFRVEARDKAAAKDLRDVVQGFVALGRLQAGKDTAVTTVLNSIQLSGGGKNVSVEFSVPSAALAAMASELPPRKSP